MPAVLSTVFCVCGIWKVENRSRPLTLGLVSDYFLLSCWCSSIAAVRSTGPVFYVVRCICLSYGCLWSLFRPGNYVYLVHSILIVQAGLSFVQSWRCIPECLGMAWRERRDRSSVVFCSYRYWKTCTVNYLEVIFLNIFIFDVPNTNSLKKKSSSTLICIDSGGMVVGFFTWRSPFWLPAVTLVKLISLELRADNEKPLLTHAESFIMSVAYVSVKHWGIRFRNILD